MEGGYAYPGSLARKAGQEVNDFAVEPAPHGLPPDNTSENLADQNNNIEATKSDLADSVQSMENCLDAGGRNLRTRNKNRKLFTEKVHHKRKTLQDMARPLKQWLYKNKDNPYPSKSQKLSLAAGSQMTVVQVSNWFANARRRLKNVVKEPNLPWSKRILLYNDNVEGNAELFSISSDDTVWNSQDDPELQETFHTDQSPLISSLDESRAAATTVSDNDLVPSRTTTPTHESRRDSFLSNVPDDFGNSLKYKQTMLQRYLTDAYQHAVHVVDDRMLAPKRDRRQSGSLGSRDYEELSTSSASSRINHRVHDDFAEEMEFPARKRRKIASNISYPDDILQKEMDAIVALTNLSKGRPRK